MNKKENIIPMVPGKVAEIEANAPDHDVIVACVEYAQAVAAVRASFAADPDGNSIYAEKAVVPYEAKAKKALTAASSTRATTAAGLDSKARILPMILDADGNSIEEMSEQFYRTFATDVRAFLNDKKVMWRSRRGAGCDWLAPRDTVEERALIFPSLCRTLTLALPQTRRLHRCMGQE